MKFVKENLTLVICGAIVLLALVSVFYPTGSWRSSWVEARGAEYHDSKQDVDRMTNMSLEVPAYPTATAPAKFKGVPPDNFIAAKAQAIKDIADQAKNVIDIGAQANRLNRVNPKGEPLLNGRPQLRYLPKIGNGVDPNEFKKEYAAIFNTWLTKLTGPDAGLPYPPRADEELTAYAAKIAAAAAAAPAGLQGMQLGQTNVREQNDYLRTQAMARASHTHMYVDMSDMGGVNGGGGSSLGAFQRRTWVDTDNPPDEGQIFEALVDSWFQSDVVSAIASVNDAELKKVDSTKRNVGAAPIKRLMHIAVGSDALTPRLSIASGAAGGAAVGGGQGASGSLFYTPAAQAAAAAGTDAPIPAAGTSAPNTIDLTRTLTGRASGADYDVVMMQIWMDIDPSYLNRFIDALYRQNMGYTVLNVRMKTVDPLDRASNGFVYGDVQTIEVELTVEGLLFRNWTQPLMPPRILTSLGIAPPAPAGQ